jgi:hypothetical protein
VIDKAALLDSARVLAHATVEVPGVGEVEVRGLSRAEVVQMQSYDSIDEMEIASIAAGLADPVLSAEEVTQWRSTKDSAEIMPVSDKILELSGLLPDQQAEAERSFCPEPGDG